MAQVDIPLGGASAAPGKTRDPPDEFRDDPDEYQLHLPLHRVYEARQGEREGVLTLGRRMAELTVPEVMPPENYRTGDNVPGNNQSIGAYCVNNLASKLMLQALPPGLPMVKFQAIEYEIQEEVQQDPDLWAKMLLAFAGLERAHRGKLATTAYAYTYVQYLKLMLIVGNGAWCHKDLAAPTFYTPADYVVRRDRNGMVRYGIVREKIAWADLDKDTREFILEHRKTSGSTDTTVSPSSPDEEEVVIYTGVKRVPGGAPSVPWEWRTWQEFGGRIIPDSEVESDYETPPIRFDWLIPVPGQDWGHSYCLEYRGDLFAVEALGSGLTDGAALAAFMLLFVAPGSQTSIRQVREAKNLAFLPGRADDVSALRSEKQADLNFLASSMEAVSVRLGRAFLLQSSVQRSGERVTREEIQRLGNELDQAMGGVYAAISQSIDRPSKMRFMLLHREVNPKLPALPEHIVDVQVTSGMDAMGQTDEAASLMDVGTGIAQVFGPQGAAESLSKGNFVQRYAASKGITDPASLIKTDAQQAEAQSAAANQAAQMDMLSKATGPIAGAAGKAMTDQMVAPPAEGAPE